MLPVLPLEVLSVRCYEKATNDIIVRDRTDMELNREYDFNAENYVVTVFNLESNDVTR